MNSVAIRLWYRFTGRTNLCKSIVSRLSTSSILSANSVPARRHRLFYNNHNHTGFTIEKTKTSSRVTIPAVFAYMMASTTAAAPLSQTVMSAKDKYLQMEQEAKRSQYKCGSKYVTLKDVLDWKDYFSKEKVQHFPGNGKYSVNNELNSKISLWQGDITVLEIDAIVNAANSSLLGGGGVDGAIHRAAGGDLLNECRELRGCPAGQAKITGGYKLPTKYVIHTVGPQGEKPETLRSCYANSLDLILQNQLKSIAFPCIATGIYGYPRVQAANVAIRTVREFLEKNANKVDRIIFTVFLEEDKEVYEELLQTYFPTQ